MLSRLSLQSLSGVRPLIVNPSASAVALRTMAARAMTTVSVAKHPHTLTPHPATEYAPAKDDQIFAVISLMGKQHKVTKDDLVVADFMGDEFDLDSKVNVDNVLLLGSKSATIVGHPTVPNTKVVLSVEEITRDKKVIALKYRRRKNSRRRKGHRRDITLLRVVDIIPDATDMGVLVPK